MSICAMRRSMPTRSMLSMSCESPTTTRSPLTSLTLIIGVVCMKLASQFLIGIVIRTTWEGCIVLSADAGTRTSAAGALGAFFSLRFQLLGMLCSACQEVPKYLQPAASGVQVVPFYFGELRFPAQIITLDFHLRAAVRHVFFVWNLEAYAEAGSGIPRGLHI